MPIIRLASGSLINTELLNAGSFVRYGRVFRAGVTKLQVELMAFLGDWKAPYAFGKVEHFRRLVSIIWPFYQWNEWSDDMAAALCANDLVAFMGCGGSGKSLMLAAWALVNWWAAPQDTAIAITSTDIEGGKRRVWGYVVTLHQQARWPDDDGNENIGKAPGKLTDQPPLVRLSDTTDGVRGGGQMAIMLVAAGNEHLNAALKILQGLHNKRIFLILDELQDLASSIIGGVLENLKLNEYFQLCAAGNIGDPNDPLGTLCRPVTPDNKGYDDVSAETQSWAIERAGLKGVCVRFDAEYSPNYRHHVSGVPDKYPFLPRVAYVEQKKQELAAGMLDMGDYYRQLKAFVTPRNVEDGRWSAAAILKFQAEIAAEWATAGGWVTVAGCDPAYTSGGDRFVFFPVRYGQSNAGIWTIEFQEPQSLQHNPLDGEIRNHAMVRQTIRLCEENGVEPRYFGVDVSGENPLGDIFAEEWKNNEFLRVNFQGDASELPVSLTDRRPCDHEYGNKCAELWCIGANFLRYGQLRGIGKTQARELSARQVRRGTQNRLFVEKKKEMKKRTGGISPDTADGGNVALEVLRVRLGAIAGAEGIKARTDAWGVVAKKTLVVPTRLRSARGIQSIRR